MSPTSFQLLYSAISFTLSMLAYYSMVKAECQALFCGGLKTAAVKAAGARGFPAESIFVSEHVSAAAALGGDLQGEPVQGLQQVTVPEIPFVGSGAKLEGMGDMTGLE